ELTEDKTYHAVVDNGRPAAVAWVHCGANLNDKAGGLLVVPSKIDTRYHALGYGQVIAAHGEAVDYYCVLDHRESVGTSQRRTLPEELVVRNAQHCEIHVRRQSLDLSFDLSTAASPLDVDIRGVQN